MTKAVESLLARLKAANLSPADDVIAAKLTGTMATLIASQLVGVNIDSELLHVKAQAANLSSAAAQQIKEEFSDWITDLAFNVITKVIVA